MSMPCELPPCALFRFAALRIVLLIRFWHPELAAEEWLSTLNSGMEEYSAMLQRRVSPPVNSSVAEAWPRHHTVDLADSRLA